VLRKVGASSLDKDPEAGLPRAIRSNLLTGLIGPWRRGLNLMRAGATGESGDNRGTRRQKGACSSHAVARVRYLQTKHAMKPRGDAQSVLVDGEARRMQAVHDAFRFVAGTNPVERSGQFAQVPGEVLGRVPEIQVDDTLGADVLLCCGSYEISDRGVIEERGIADNDVHICTSAQGLRRVSRHAPNVVMGTESPLLVHRSEC